MYAHHLSNHQILAKMDEYVYGHTYAKKVLINAVNRASIRWQQQYSLGMPYDDLLPTKNVLLIAESGTGKTLLIETLAEICDTPFLRFDATQIKPSGSGDGLTVKQMIKDIQVHCAWLAKKCEGEYTTKEIMSKTVVFIDEICKLAMSADSSGNWNKSVQSNLLQLIDGKTEIQGVTWVFAGAFQDMLTEHKKSNTKKSIGFHNAESETEETDWEMMAIKAGIIPELMGRMSSVVKLDTLTLKDYNNILDDYVLPKIHGQLEYYNYYNFVLTEKMRKEVLTKAMRSGQGVRSLTKQMQSMVEGYEFDFEINAQKLLLTLDTDIGDMV